MAAASRAAVRLVVATQAAEAMEIRARAREGATKAEVAAAAGDRGVGGDDDDTQEEGGAGTRGTTSGQWRDKADGGGRGRRETKGGWRQMMAACAREY